MTANIIGNGLPDRAVANMFEIVDHVIEHAMTQRTDVVPIGGIEAHVRF
jgi:hypothetical protein